MPIGIPIHDEFTHLGSKNAWHARHKEVANARRITRRNSNKEQWLQKEYEYRIKNASHISDANKAYKKRNPKQVMLDNARARAKRHNYPCTITVDDFNVPEYCPLSGVRLVYNIGVTRDNSPSLDKINPTLGYVPGNVRVISRKGNRWKQEMTREDVVRLLDYIDGKI